MAATQGLSAKYLPPTAVGAVPRERLFVRLDEAHACWIAAPPGAGKTVLAASYVQARRRPCLWYQIDAADADPATFFHYLGRAAEQASQRQRPQLPALTPEYGLGLPVFVLRYFEALYARLPPGTVLVFDDYESLPADAPTHELIVRALELAPSSLSFIVLSREEAPAAYSRLHVHGALTLLGGDALHLDCDEIAALALGRCGEAPAPTSIARLLALTEGWAAGVCVLLEYLRETPVERLAQRGGHTLFEYFTAEVLAGMDETTRRVLLATSVAPRFTAAMATALSGEAHAPDIVERLVRHNCFILRRDAEPHVYQYHMLFREFLLGQPAAVGDGRAAQIRAAELAEAAGWLEEAAALYRAAEHWPGLARICKDVAPRLLSEGRNQPLAQWIGALPPELLGDSPWLLYWFGRARSPYDPRGATAHFDLAFNGFERGSDVAGQYLAWAAAVETIAMFWDDFRSLDAWLARLGALQRRDTVPPSLEVEAAVAASALLAVTWRAPDHPQAGLWLERCEDLVRAETDVNRQLLLGSSVLLHHLIAGKMDRAAALIERLDPAAAAPQAVPLARLAWYCWLVTYHWNHADLARCLSVDQAARELADHSGVHVVDSRIRPQLAYVYLNAGDWRSAEPIVAEFACMLDPSRQLDVAHYHLLAGWTALLRGDYASARGHSQIQLRLSREIGGPFPLGMALLLAALRCVEEGDADAAERHLAEVRGLVQRSGFLHLDVGANVIEADLRERAGDLARALPALSAGLKRAREIGLISWFPFHPAAMARLCATALRHRIEVDYVRELLHRRALTPDRPPVDVEDWPWPVRIYALGAFEVIVDEVPVRFEGKAQRKPLELLKALVALGGREVAASRLAEALWPDSEGDAALNAFGVTLTRLRKLVGGEAVLLRDGRLSLNVGHCWLDVWAFEDRLARGKGGEEAAEAGGEFVLYRGHFLSGEDAAWAIAMRQRLEGRFVRRVEQVCERLCAGKACAEAIDACRQGIELCELAAELYQRLLRCHRCRGEGVQAEAVQVRWRDVLVRRLGAAAAERFGGLA